MYSIFVFDIDWFSEERLSMPQIYCPGLFVCALLIFCWNWWDELLKCFQLRLWLCKYWVCKQIRFLNSFRLHLSVRSVSLLISTHRTRSARIQYRRVTIRVMGICTPVKRNCTKFERHTIPRQEQRPVYKYARAGALKYQTSDVWKAYSTNDIWSLGHDRMLAEWI